MEVIQLVGNNVDTKKGEPWRNLQFNPVKLRLVQINFIVPNCYFRIGYMLSLNQYSAPPPPPQILKHNVGEGEGSTITLINGLKKTLKLKMSKT